MIGNGNYRNEKTNSKCRLCFRDDQPFDNLDIYESIERLKVAYERLGFIVLAFIDLNTEEFLRVIKLVELICQNANQVMILFHVIGHGKNYKSHDFLLPRDYFIEYHYNNHIYFDDDFKAANFKTFMENFRTKFISGKNFMC